MQISKSILFFLLFFIQQNVFALDKEMSQNNPTSAEKKIDSLLNIVDDLAFEDDNLNLRILKQAEIITLKNNNEKKLGEVYTAFGVYYYIRGVYDLSLEMHFKAIKIHEKYKNYSNLSRSLNGVGLVQLELNQFNEAITSFKECVVYNTKLKRFAAVGRNYFNIALAEIEHKNYLEVSKNLKISLSFVKKYHDYRTEHMVYNRLGDAKLMLNDIDSSLYFYQKVFNKDHKYSTWEKVYSYRGLAQVYLKNNNYNAAIQYGLLSLELAKKIDTKWDIVKSAESLADIYAAKHEMENAYKYLNEAKIYNDSLLNENKIKEINYLQLKSKEAENSRLKNKNAISLEREKTDRTITYSFGVLIIFLLGILLLLMRNIKIKDRFNSELQQKNRDIEDQKAIIDFQRESLEGLNKSKNKLFSILSHDLKTPINSIYQILELHQQGEMTLEFQEEIFEQLHKQVEGTSKMLNNLLFWASSQMDGIVVNFENINLTDVVTTAIDSLYMEAFKKKITIKHFNKENRFIHADIGQARIIVQNILANAIKFTPIEGIIEVFYSQDGNYKNLHILDFGEGMNETVVNDIINFDKRMTSELGTAMEEGTGLGLLLVKQFLVNNKGKMDLKSEKGKGTEFIISFLKAK